MANKNGGDIKFRVGFQTDQSSLNKLKTSLQDLQKIKLGDFKGSAKDLDEMQETAKKVQIALEKAFNPTLNTTNISTFQSELQKTVGNIDQVYKKLKLAGPQGEVAFHQMATEVLTTNLQLKETNSLIDSMGKTMVNTVKWGIASSIMNTFTQSVQGAFQYVQSLEKSLTNIRIVTGDSTERMAQFAEQANRSAQALGRSTLDYSKASLTFYQQGLNDEDVQARTEATLKAQNITGAGAQMADYLTSVWNGYKVANEEAELYVDKLAAVADSSASDMSQLAVAMSKVASTANNMGVDVDQLNAQIATVVATTRQAPEAVGTAFKTIYTRMNDIKAGSDEAEISLGNYSGKMAELGINVLDATGHLRDTGQVMDQIGERWSTMTKEQQVYLAQTMGGQRQVNQLMALFDNWTTYSELLNTSLESEGTLAEKNARYMESLGAKMEQLGSAGERVKDALINENELKGGVQALTNLVNLMGNFIESIGGGSTALLAFGALATQVFQDTIARQINSIITNIQNKNNNELIKQQDIENTRDFGESQGYKEDVINNLVDRKQAIQQYYNIMSEGEVNAYNNIIKTVAAAEQESVVLEKRKEVAEAFYSTFSQNSGYDPLNKDNFEDINTALGIAVQDLLVLNDQVQDLSKKEIKPDSKEFLNTLELAKEKIQDLFKGSETQLTGWQPFIDKLKELQSQSNVTEQDLNKIKNAFGTVVKQASYTAGEAGLLPQISQQAEMAEAKLKAATRESENFQKQIQQLASVRTFTQTIAGIGQLTAGIRSLTNLTKVWKNENLSAGEKILQTFTNLSMTLPMLINGYSKMTSGIKNFVSGIQMQILATEADTKAIYEKAFAQTYSTTGNYAEAVSAGKAALAQEAHSISLDKVIAKLYASYGAALPYIAILGVLAGAIFLAYKEWNKEADAAKKASEVAADAKKTYDDLKTSLQNVKSALDDLHSAEENLDGLTKGTQEWRDALQQCNDKVLELISNYPELAQYVTNENGQLKLNAEGEQAYLDRLQAGVQNARNTSYIASSNSREADVMAAAADIGHNSTYGTNTAGQGGGYASAEQVKTVVQAIDKVVGEGADLKGGLSGLTDKIVDQTGQSKELVSAILSNEDAILQLRTQLQQNETADKLMYKTMAQGALADNSTFKGMDELGQQVASAIGGADLESKVQQIEADLMKTMTDGVAIWSGSSNQQVKKILNQLNDAQGTNWKLDSNAVRGTDSNRTFAFLDQAGQLHTYTKEQIASTIAAKQALEDLGASAEDASKVLASIDSKISDTAKDAVKQWASGQDMTSLTRNGLGDLQGQNLIDIFNEDELKSLAEVRNINIEQTGWQDKLQQDWDKSLQYISSAFDNVAKDASSTVQTAFSNIKNNDSIKNASLEFQQMVVEDMQKAFDKGGKNSLDQISKLYGEQIQDFEKFDSVIKDFDFSKGAIALGDALKEAGAATDISTQALQAYIRIQQQQAKVLSPEGTYAAVHEVTDKVKKRGDKIDANQAAVLTQAGVNVDSFFVRLLDGSYKLITSIDAFQQHINNVTVQPFKAKMAELQAQIDNIHTFENGAYSSKNMNIEEFSSVAGNITNITGTNVQAVTGQDTDKLRAQVEFLKIVGEEDRAIAQAEEAINQKRTLGAEYLQRISALIKEHANDYENLSEVEKRLLEQSNAIQDSVSNTLKPPLDQDVKGETWEKLTQHLEDYADQIDGVSAQLKDNAEAAGDVAEAILRYDSALGKVKKNFDGWLESLSSDSIADHAEIAEQLQNVYSDLLDLPFDNVLSDDFLQNVDNLNLLKQAANGSEQAYRKLQETAAQDILAQVGLDDSQFYIDKDAIEQSLYQLTGQEWDDIEIGASLEDEAFLNELTNMVNAAGMTAEQATDYLASMGVDAEVIEHDTTATENQTAIGYRPVETGPQTFTDTVSYFGPDGQIQTGQVHYAATGYSYEAIPIENQAEKQNKSFSLEVKSAKKASGGGFKYRNASAGNKGGGGSKGKGKGGGGGGKGSQPKAAKTVDKKQPKKDRYYKVNARAKRQADALEKLKKQQEQLTGKDTLKNLDKQLKILEKQENTIRSRLALQRQERDQIKNDLKKYGGKFDKEGILSNYDTVFDNIYKQYNQVVKWYEGLSGEQQDEESNKQKLKKAEEALDKGLKKLEEYETISEKIRKDIQEIYDNAQETIDKQVQKFHIKIDAAIDFTQARNDYQDFLRDIKYQIRDDDIIGLNKYTFNKLGNYYNQNQTGSIQQLRQQLDDAINNRGGIYSTVVKDEYGNRKTIIDKEKQQADIKDLTQKIQKELENYQDLIEDIRNSIFDILDETDKAFKEQIDEYEYISDLIDHNVKVTQLLFGDDAYAQLEKYYDKIEENNNAQLDFLRQRQQMWYENMKREQKDMQSLDPTSNLYKQAQDRFKQYEKLWMESQKDLNSLVEKSIQDLQDKYANSIDNIFTQFELKLTKGLRFDTIEDEWDKINDLADMYLDKINGMYQIDKLENAFQDAIDNASDSLSAQQSLNELMNEQLGYLRDKDKLTQYDVDRANALLQIEIKRLALEQSRSSKTKLRLRRDSQGNYSYQYVANQQENNKAQQELADAQNSLYNTTKETYRNNLSDITKVYQEGVEAVKSLTKEADESNEDFNRRKADIYAYYDNKINNLLEQNSQLRNDLMQDSFDQLAKMYGINAEQFNAMTEQQKNSIMTNLFPQWGSLAQQMADTLKAEGGFYQTIVGPIQEAAAANKDYYDGLNKIQLSSGQAFGAIVTGQDNLINKGKELLDHNDDLVNSWENQIKAVQGTIDKVNELSNAYINAKDNGQTIFQEITKGYQKGSFASDLSILGTTGTADSTARKNEYYNQYDNIIKESQSTSDLKDYQPESYTITNLRQLLKKSDLTSSSTPGVLSSFDSNNKTSLKTLIETTVDLNKQYNNINLDSILTSMDNKISNINLNIERLLADNINKLSEIKEVLVNNSNTIEQKVDIQATFPSLVEIKTIQDAFDNLVNRAAQSAGKNGL